MTAPDNPPDRRLKLKGPIGSALADDSAAMRDLRQAGHLRKLKKKEILLLEGERPESLFLLVHGTLAVCAPQDDGNELLLAYVHPGEFCGEMGLFPDVAERSARIYCRNDCEVLEVEYPRFLELTRTHTSLWIALASQLAERLRNVNRKLARMPGLNAAERVWFVLQELALRSDAPREHEGKLLKITREDLGKLSGCTREMAGLVLHELAEQGRVLLRGQAIIVPDEAMQGPPPLA
ncbi:MAG: cyclic nucleotide-binding domain-containing protein [Panacagrimonas sp.]